MTASRKLALEVRDARPRSARHDLASAALALAALGCRFGYEELGSDAIGLPGGSVVVSGGSAGTWSTTGTIGTPLGGSSGSASVGSTTGSPQASTGGNASTGSATGVSSGGAVTGGSASQGGTSGAASEATGDTTVGGSVPIGSTMGGTSHGITSGGTASTSTITGGSSAASLGGTSSQGGTSGASSAQAGSSSVGGSAPIGGTSSDTSHSIGSGGTASTSTITGGSSAASLGGTSSQGGTSGTTTSGTGGSPVPYCNALPYLSAVPVLDGVLDANLHIETIVPQGWSNWTTPLPVGISLAFAAAWHESGFYFFLRVTDPELNPAAQKDPVWRGDAVEIYVDHDAVFAPPNTFDAIGTRQFVVGSPAAASSTSTRGDIFVADGVERSWPGTQWMGIATTDGYIVEAFVVAADLSLAVLQLAAGQNVGFDLGHDVSYPIGQTGYFGNRLGQYFLKVRQPFSGQGTDYPFIDTSVFCTPTLLRG